jgi:hypothetical protein
MSRRVPSIVAVLAAVAAGMGPALAAGMFDAANATNEIAGASFTHAHGEAPIKGPSGVPGAPHTPIPNGYTLAASASGDLGSGGSGEAVALYRGFGANLQWVILFGFVEEGGTFKQIAASAAYQEDSKVESVSVDQGTVSLDLLVVSEADKEKPHYEQKPTEPLTLTFTIKDGAFAATE